MRPAGRDGAEAGAGRGGPATTAAGDSDGHGGAVGMQEVSQHEEKLIELGGRSARETTGRIGHDAEGDRERAATVRQARRGGTISVAIDRDDDV